MNEEIKQNYPSSFATFGDKAPFPITWNRIHALTTDTASFICRNTIMSRQARQQGRTEEADRLKSGCGGCTPSAFCVGGRTEECIMALTQCAMSDTDHIPTDQMDAVQELIASDSHAMFRGVTNSQSGVRIFYRWTAVTLDGEVLPPSYFRWNKDKETHRDFLRRVLPWHDAAFRLGNAYYAELLGYDYDLHTSDAARISFYCHDPHALFRSDAVPFAVHESMLEHQHEKAEHQRFSRPDFTAHGDPFVLAPMWVSRRLTYTKGHRNQFIAQCLYILRDLGVSEMEAAAWVESEFCDYESEGRRRGMVKAVFRR